MPHLAGKIYVYVPLGTFSHLIYQGNTCSVYHNIKDRLEMATLSMAGADLQEGRHQIKRKTFIIYYI